MAIALHQEDELARMEENIRQRPNGPRVLREMLYLDGKLASSLLKAGEFPLVIGVIGVLAAVTLALVIANTPPAQSAVVDSSVLAAADADGQPADVQRTE